MPELVSLQSEDFDLVIWSKDVERNRSRFARTLAARGKVPSKSLVRISPPIAEKHSEAPQDEIPCEGEEPVFFENSQYDFEFVFSNSLKSSFHANLPRCEHRLRSVEESFHYSSRTNSLRATINTGNDVGWFGFELVYQTGAKTRRHHFSFEIHPTKMDMASDLQVMNTAIDEAYPLWRFAFAEKTDHHMQAVKQPHPDFLLLWLSLFEQLQSDLERGLKHIVNAPHSRLVSQCRSTRMEGLKGRLGVRLEEDVGRRISDGETSRRFELNKKILSLDTPENRFIKQVTITAALKLSKIRSAAAGDKNSAAKKRTSESFLKKLESWHSSIAAYRRHPLFREVGRFTGLSSESLVLQQKSGYAKVYRVWQQLKWYLDSLEGNSSLSVKNVAKLYEVWCFLEIRQILLNLGFVETRNNPVPMVNTGTELKFRDGLGGAFHFRRDDGVKLRLAHEPRFSKSDRHAIRSWTTAQKPDIFLEASFPSDEKIVWLFDAKYRIKSTDDVKPDDDLAPDDAINQMHRYRDALVQMGKADYSKIQRKSRPVFGAYALYPGYFDQKSGANPYSTEIEEVGIGAFSLLPTANGSGNIWLTNFLQSKLGKKPSETDSYFVEEAPRIPYAGTEVRRFRDLAIIANQLGPERTVSYTDAFASGDASFYHTRTLAFSRQSIEQHVIREAGFLAVALDSSCGQRIIEYVYPIVHAEVVKRGDINAEQAGTLEISDPEAAYWFFTLGASLKLKNPVFAAPDLHFRIKLASWENLSSTATMEELPDRYAALFP
jgi:hypothetical protein